eukprot:4119105-Alexandrium_andersonii.AAC.1
MGHTVKSCSADAGCNVHNDLRNSNPLANKRRHSTYKFDDRQREREKTGCRCPPRPTKNHPCDIRVREMGRKGHEDVSDQTTRQIHETLTDNLVITCATAKR